MTLSDRLDSERTDIKCRICNHFLIYRSANQADCEYNDGSHWHHYCGFCRKFICKDCGIVSFEVWYCGTESARKVNLDVLGRTWKEIEVNRRG